MLRQIEKPTTGELIGCAFGSIPTFQRVGVARFGWRRSFHRSTITTNRCNQFEVDQLTAIRRAWL